MSAWNGEEDGYVTKDKDTWADVPRDEKSAMHDGLADFEIPSEDWVEGFVTAIEACAKVVEVKCYPTLMGEALRKLGRDVVAEWERRQNEEISR